MHYDITYTTEDRLQKALDDADQWLGESVVEKIKGFHTKKLSAAQLSFVMDFWGIKGYPVAAIGVELKWWSTTEDFYTELEEQR